MYFFRALLLLLIIASLHKIYCGYIYSSIGLVGLYVSEFLTSPKTQGQTRTQNIRLLHIITQSIYFCNILNIPQSAIKSVQPTRRVTSCTSSTVVLPFPSRRHYIHCIVTGTHTFKVDKFGFIGKYVFCHILVSFCKLFV